MGPKLPRRLRRRPLPLPDPNTHGDPQADLFLFLQAPPHTRDSRYLLSWHRDNDRWALIKLKNNGQWITRFRHYAGLTDPRSGYVDYSPTDTAPWKNSAITPLPNAFARELLHILDFDSFREDLPDRGSSAARPIACNTTPAGYAFALV